MKKWVAGLLSLALLLVPIAAMADDGAVQQDRASAVTEDASVAMNDWLQKERNAAVLYEKMTDAFGEDTPYARLAEQKQRRVQMLEARMEEQGIPVTASEGQANASTDEFTAIQEALSLEKEIALDFDASCRAWDEQGERTGFGMHARHASRNVRLLEALSESLERGESSTDFMNRFGMQGYGWRDEKSCHHGRWGSENQERNGSFGDGRAFREERRAWHRQDRPCEDQFQPSN